MKKYSIVLTLLLATIMWQCARQGVVTGGPKDISPPVLIEANPPQRATQFDKQSFELVFNEYIQGSKIGTSLKVSPPLKKNPRVIVKAKSFEVRFADTLKQNTTYTFSFGNSIADNNEGNVLSNFEYVFSTGTYIDSLGVKGRVLNAFDLKEEKDGYLAILHEDLSDSSVYNHLPSFVAYSTTKGVFSINNVKPGTYRLYALKDLNSNLRFDPLTEKIGFADTLIHLQPALFTYRDTSSLKSDTVFNDHLKQIFKPIAEKQISKSSKDSAILDSILQSGSLYSIHTDLFLFQEKNPQKRLKENRRNSKYNISLKFTQPTHPDSIKIWPLWQPILTNWYSSEWKPGLDSIVYWFTDSTIFNIDTLKLVVSYPATDKYFNEIKRTDTINFRFIEKVQKQKDGRLVIKPVKPVINVSQNSNLEWGKVLTMKTKLPVKSVFSDSIQLFRKKDTLWLTENFNIKSDSLEPRTWNINFKRLENSQYKLLLTPGAFQYIYPILSDTVETEFKIPLLETYGLLTLILKNVKSPLIVQLIKGSEIVKEMYANTDQRLKFEFLTPNEYEIKLIHDRNGNKQWDTGDLLRKIQPEKIEFYKTNQKIRANSEYEIVWEL